MGEVQAYLAALPEAERSYPECLMKASVYRTWLQDLSADAVAEALPASLRPLIRDPEPVTAWIPEVHTNAIFMAGLDAVFGSREAFVAHYERMNEKLFSGPLYRVLMKVASPAIVVRGAVSRWKSFHRGANLTTENVQSGSGTVRVEAPPGLYSRLLAEAYAGSFVVALRLAGGKDVTMTLTEFTETGFTYQGTWR